MINRVRRYLRRAAPSHSLKCCLRNGKLNAMLQLGVAARSTVGSTLGRLAVAVLLFREASVTRGSSCSVECYRSCVFDLTLLI